MLDLDIERFWRDDEAPPRQLLFVDAPASASGIRMSDEWSRGSLARRARGFILLPAPFES